VARAHRDDDGQALLGGVDARQRQQQPPRLQQAQQHECASSGSLCVRACVCMCALVGERQRRGHESNSSSAGADAAARAPRDAATAALEDGRCRRRPLRCLLCCAAWCVAGCLHHRQGSLRCCLWPHWAAAGRAAGGGSAAANGAAGMQAARTNAAHTRGTPQALARAGGASVLGGKQSAWRNGVVACTAPGAAGTAFLSPRRTHVLTPGHTREVCVT
jgi:hypothetical protein